jgi:hypothetical protein
LTSISGQTSDTSKILKYHEASLDLCAFYTPLISTATYGLNFDFKYYPHKKFATGFCSSITSKKIGNTFQYAIGQPILSYYELGWINQYDFLQTDRIRIGVNINNGIAISELGDNDIKVKYWTRYGVSTKAKEISTNYFYLLQPGIDMSFRLLSNNHNPDLYLTTKAKYRFVFGDSNYGRQSDFTNYYFGLGLSIIGFTDNKHKTK